MSRHYSDPERQNDPYALTDFEVFYMSTADFLNADEDTWMADLMADSRDLEEAPQAARQLQGWYYWYCFPGCLPEGDAIGPFKTEEQALADARDNA